MHTESVNEGAGRPYPPPKNVKLPLDGTSSPGEKER